MLKTCAFDRDTISIFLFITIKKMSVVKLDPSSHPARSDPNPQNTDELSTVSFPAPPTRRYTSIRDFKEAAADYTAEEHPDIDLLIDKWRPKDSSFPLYDKAVHDLNPEFVKVMKGIFYRELSAMSSLIEEHLSSRTSDYAASCENSFLRMVEHGETCVGRSLRDLAGVARAFSILSRPGAVTDEIREVLASVIWFSRDKVEGRSREVNFHVSFGHALNIFEAESGLDYRLKSQCNVKLDKVGHIFMAVKALYKEISESEYVWQPRTAYHLNVAMLTSELENALIKSGLDFATHTQINKFAEKWMHLSRARQYGILITLLNDPYKESPIMELAKLGHLTQEFAYEPRIEELHELAALIEPLQKPIFRLILAFRSDIENSLKFITEFEKLKDLF